jgi:tetratricopeptide (TPR) repeat protein
MKKEINDMRKERNDMKKILSGLAVIVLMVCVAVSTVILAENAGQIMDEKSFIEKFTEAHKANDEVKMAELVRQAGPQIVYNVIISESTRGLASVAEGKDGSKQFDIAELMATNYAREFKQEALLQQVKKYKLYDQEMSREKLKGDRLVKEGLSAYGKSQWEESRRQFNEALLAFDKIGDLFGRSSALAYIGDTNMRLGNYQRALAIYQQGLELKQRIGDVGGQAATLSNIGATYKSLKQYDEALKFYNRSIKEYQKMEDKAGETKLLREIDNIHDNVRKDSEGR